MSGKEEILKNSWFNCYKNGVKKDLQIPQNSVTQNKLLKIKKENFKLIEVFEKQVKEIDKDISIESMFLLVDENGVLISRYSISDDKEHNNIKIKEGVYFTEESLGTNAVSLTMEIKEYITLNGEEHYCNIFSEWSCLAGPIKINNQIIGYLDYSKVNSKISRHDEMMFKLLLSKITNKMRDQILYCKLDESSLDEIDLEIIRLSANGYIIEEISEIIHMSESTIKSRRKKICNLLNAKNITHATVKAIKCQCLSLDEIK